MNKIQLLLLAAAIFFNALANILIKFGMLNQKTLLQNNLIQMFIKIITNPFAFLGITSFGVAFILYSAVLSKLDLSVAYPIMTGVGFLLVLVASYFFFHEHINLYRIIGIISIILGITIISMKG